MGHYLVFRLYGPMAAWGDVAVGERRLIGSSPSKSGVLGLVGAALGVRRDDADGQRSLHEGYGFASRVDDPGMPLTDYQTAQTPAEKLIKDRPPIRRADELAFSRQDRGLQTILSWRDYRTDASALGCVYPLDAGTRWSLEQLAEALQRPVFTLYLGRKGCPLALPLCPTLVEADHPTAALQQPRSVEESFLAELSDIVGYLPRRAHNATLYWEGDEGSVQAEWRETRRDQARSRVRWQFAEREQKALVVRKEPDARPGERRGEPS
jgi:CRISPR system Cascade subunit CasD